jgi:hypothetical protein
MAEVKNAEFTLQQQTVLNLLEKHADYINSALDILDSKAQENINISSVITGIVGAFFSATNLAVDLKDSLDKTNILCIFAVYVAIFVLCFAARFPQGVDTYPMKPTYDNAMRWASMDITAVFENLSSTYVDIIENNEKVMYRKALLIRISTGLVGVIVLLIVLGVLS